jgi:nucleosome binding factor SPN SPT16 subunit
MHQFGLKNFDMIFVFKDFKRPVQHINTIPMESIDAVKDWLNGVEMPFYEGNLNLQWGSIMKTVQEDPYTFFKDGGWSFLANDSEDEDGEDESEDESAFEMDESDFGSEASSEDESDFDENASQEAEDNDVSDDDEGEDWDELEKKAARKDREAAAEDGKGKAAASKPSRKRKR